MISKCWTSQKSNIEQRALSNHKNISVLMIHTQDSLFCKAIKMRLNFKTCNSIFKKVLFVMLFAVLVSRVIVALKKLDNKELYAHSFSPKEKKKSHIFCI